VNVPPLLLRGLKWMIAWVMGVFVLSLPAGASTARADGARLIINETIVLTLRSSVGGNSPAVRAADIAQRLSAAQTPVQWQLNSRRKESTLKANGLLVLRVTEVEAKAQQSSHAALAARWTSAIKRAWNLPPFVISQRLVQMPTDGSASVTLRGASAYYALVANNNPTVARVERTDFGLRIMAVGRGAARITLQEGANSAVVDVDVMPYAARFPQRLRAEVVGEPATGTVIRRAVLAALNHGFTGEPGNAYRLIASPVRTINSGGREVVRWRVQATAPGAFTQVGEVLTEVVNLGVKTWPEGALWYCNFPENLKGPTHLFQAPLMRGTSARMLYHHVNESTSSLVMKVVVANPGATPARVAIVPGDGQPSKDPVKVGLDAGEQFLQGWLRHTGEVVTIPPGAAIPITLRRLARHETSSGLCTLMLLTGGPESVTVLADAVLPASLDANWLAKGQNATPWVTSGARAMDLRELIARVDSEHIYPRPFRTLEARYEVGQRYLFLRVGEVPIGNANASQDLQGNFGVAYTVRTLLVNPLAVNATVQIAFEASAGYSGALFVVNGEVRRAPLLMPKAEYVVKEVRLRPGESRTVSFMTIPLSGSSYPATVIVRPRTSLANVLR